MTAVYVPNTIQNGYEENDTQQRQNQETDSMMDENDRKTYLKIILKKKIEEVWESEKLQSI